MFSSNLSVNLQKINPQEESTKANSLETERRSHSKNNLKIPFDTAPKSAVLKPGEKIRLYGWIYFENKTDQDIEVSVYFHLDKGFEITAKNSLGEILKKEFASMHSKYQLNSDNSITRVDGQKAAIRALKNAMHKA